MAGKTQAGMFLCNDCRQKFSAMVGTVMERSHIPLHKWVLAMHLMAASKKGISAHQLHRMLGITYKSAWFLAHRIREAMTDPTAGPLGGPDRAVEVDETYVGGKAENRATKPPPKKAAVMALVERDGEARSFHIANVTAKTLRPIIVKAASRKSFLMTDELATYEAIGREFEAHGTVNHSSGEYVRKAEGVKAGFYHTNTVENYFSILKRGIYGFYQHVSEAHLHRYVAEFDLRCNTRAGLGIDDTGRAARLLKGTEGKRFRYRQPRSAAHAQAAGETFQPKA
jgi:transposase-like protein